jgi:hypothetical protein
MLLDHYKRISTSDDFFYIIVDKSNRNILAATESRAAAMALSLWQSRISIIVMANKNSRPEDQKSVNDFLDLQRYYQMVLGDPHEDFVLLSLKGYERKPLKLLRKEVIVRLLYQTKLASRCERATITVPENLFLEKYSESILSELNKCCPEKNYYTEPIKDYARLTDCSDESAFNELTLHMDNLSHSRIRNLGIYVKFRNKLNDADGKIRSQKSVYEEFLQEMVGNSRI